MESVLLIVAVATCVYLLCSVVELVLGFANIKNLARQCDLPKSELPSLSIILSALNEERDIENALFTLLQLDYPKLEIIAINDRSTDKTPEILDRLHQTYPALKVCHIKELPAGWFGKNHALYLGSQCAKGDWLLFTDADVNMRHDTLMKAVAYVSENKLDHLTIYEKHHRNDFWLKILLLGMYVIYSIHTKPWRIRYAWSKRSLGHGAFNLVNKRAYDACGGHAAIAMECLDDLQLGALLKKNGFHRDTVDGRDFVERQWYTSLADMIHGMKKNSFAYYNYQIIPACRDSLLAVIFYLWPIIAVFVCSGMIRVINLANITIMLYISVCVAKHFRLQKWFAAFYPIGVGILLYTVFNSVISVCKNKGVTWRGTFYPLTVIQNKRISG